MTMCHIKTFFNYTSVHIENSLSSGKGRKSCQLSPEGEDCVLLHSFCVLSLWCPVSWETCFVMRDAVCPPLPLTWEFPPPSLLTPDSQYMWHRAQLICSRGEGGVMVWRLSITGMELKKATGAILSGLVLDGTTFYQTPSPWGPTREEVGRGGREDAGP